MSITRGALYVVATPLGHLGDFSERARAILSEVDVIAAEDTRHSGRLLRHFGIATPCLALHEHNEREVAPRLIERLRAGQAVALVSDAGTPLVSDPGFHLVRLAHQAGCRVIPVPGPSAVVAALSVSGLPADRFVFEGFLPAKAAARDRRLEALRAEPRTLVFYEAPHRVLATLKAMARIFGPDRECAFLRELSKLHETVRTGTLGGLLAWVEADPQQRRGEIVLVVRGAPRGAAPEEDSAIEVLRLLLEELPLSRAVTLAAKLTGVSRNRLYRQAVALRDGP